jgi:hypothetical protein
MGNLGKMTVVAMVAILAVNRIEPLRNLVGGRAA